MTIQLLDRGAIRAEARSLLHTVKPAPFRVTLLLLAIRLVLDLVGAASDHLFPTVSAFSFAGISVSFASTFLNVLIMLISTVLYAGYRCYCLGAHCGGHVSYETLFDAFGFAGKVIALTVVEGIFIGLWSLLFVVPGIIAAYRYSFAMWNLCDNPSLGVMEALDMSRKQTQGYKSQLLLLQLSFWPYLLAAGVLFGVYESAAEQIPDTFVAIMGGTLIYALLAGAVDFFLMPYYNLSACGFYCRAVGKAAAEEAAEKDPWEKYQ